MNIKLKRVLASAAVVLLLLTLIFSPFFVAFFHNHDCHGEHCAICRGLQIFANCLKMSAGLISAFAAGASLTVSAACRIRTIFFIFFTQTPVEKKERMLN